MRYWQRATCYRGVMQRTQCHPSNQADGYRVPRHNETPPPYSYSANRECPHRRRFSMDQLYADNSLTIGHTPLVKLNRITKHKIYAKLESRNPAGSVKCRIGANMIWDAEQSGRLKPGMALVEPTSGNTGIALAFVAAARGYPITLTMPNMWCSERRKVLEALGAEFMLAGGAKGMKGAFARAQEIVDSDPTHFLRLQQFEIPANPAIHE